MSSDPYYVTDEEMNDVYDRWENRNLFEVLDDIQQNEPMDVEQEGGDLREPLPPLYDFQVSPLTYRRSQHLGVEERVAAVQLHENEVPNIDRYNLLEQLTLALTRRLGCDCG